MRRSILLFAAGATLLAAGCAEPRERYPSLARRPVERVSGTLAPAEPTPGAAADPAPVPSADIAARIAALLTQARDAHRAFGQSAAGAADGALGSETWAAASIAIARREAQYDIALGALSEIDAIAVDRRIALRGGTDATTDLITAAQDEVSGYVGTDGAALAR